MTRHDHSGFARTVALGNARRHRYQDKIADGTSTPASLPDQSDPQPTEQPSVAPQPTPDDPIPAESAGEPLSLDASVAVPQAGRRYDYLLGGKDNFAVDRRSGDELKKVFPAITAAVQENRRFMRRAVHYLAAECGIEQFLDVGVGMPLSPNVHQVAQTVIPAARVVYVDHDPVVGVHARALLTGSTPGERVFVLGDLRRPRAILDNPELHGVLDLQRPIGLLLVGVLHFIADDDLAYAGVEQLVAGISAGSYVALAHVTYDPLPFEVAAQLTAMSAPEAGHGPFRARTREQVAHFLDGLDIIAPGLVSTVEWHPERHPPAEAPVAEAAAYAAVAHLR